MSYLDTGKMTLSIEPTLSHETLAQVASVSHVMQILLLLICSYHCCEVFKVANDIFLVAVYNR